MPRRGGKEKKRGRKKRSRYVRATVLERVVDRRIVLLATIAWEIAVRLWSWWLEAGALVIKRKGRELPHVPVSRSAWSLAGLPLGANPAQSQL